MNKFFLTNFFIFFISSISAQTLRQHIVDTLDTLDKIAQSYGVLEEDIIELNPDVIDEFSVGYNLIIPIPISKKLEKEVREIISYKIHRVRKKETLYGISKKYEVSIDEIKENNKELYDRALKFKDKLYIPKYKTRPYSRQHQMLKSHSVLPKEGKWRIAHNYGITIKQLEALNPGLDSLLSVGQIINVPNINLDNKEPLNINFDYYEVLPDEGFYSLNEKLGIDRDSLEKLNPILKEIGLNAGMVLKIPTKKNLDSKSIELIKSIKNLRSKSIALLLPFKANSINFKSLKIAKQQINRDGYVRISTEFYSGVEMALDSVKELGISVDLDVYDTDATSTKLQKLLNKNDFSRYDAILGPMTVKNCDLLAKSLQSKKTPVLSPFVKFEERSSNLLQTIPNDEWISNKLLKYAKKDTIPHETLIISDKYSRNNLPVIKSYFTNAKVLNSEIDKNGNEQFHIPFKILKQKLNQGRTVIFLETNNESFASNITSMLSGLNGKEFKRELILMTTNYNKAFMGNSISNEDLSNLSFQFFSTYFNNDIFNSFDYKYKKKFGNFPTRYAKRGFDLTFDLILRLSYSDSFFAELTSFQTQYLENKFKYIESDSGGYINQSGFILKYQDLYLIKIED